MRGCNKPAILGIILSITAEFEICTVQMFCLLVDSLSPDFVCQVVADVDHLME